VAAVADHSGETYKKNLYALFALSCGLVYVFVLATQIIARLWRREVARDLMFCFGAGLTLAILH
jgi:hypothetical protein